MKKPAPVTIHAAKTQLSRLIEKVERGEEVVIARRNVPVARLVPIRGRKTKRAFGSMKGRARVGDAFFEPLPASELERWE